MRRKSIVCADRIVLGDSNEEKQCKKIHHMHAR